MEELFIYQLPDGQRVDVSNWPETEKFLWLASNPNAKAVEATEEETGMQPMDESMFGGGKMRILPEDPFMPVPKYQDFDLDKMTERLFKEDFSANFGIPPGPEPLIGNVEEFDRMFGDIGNTVFGDDISIYDVSTGRSYASKLSKPKNYKEADKLDETTLNQIKKVYNQVGGLDPERDNYAIAGFDGEAFGQDVKPEDQVYGQRDIAAFLKQPGIRKALDEGLIEKQDLMFGMYPGYTGWVHNYDDIIKGTSKIFIEKENRYLKNHEVFEIMWQNDMPYWTDVERLKRQARKKVDRFVLRTPDQIASVIDLEKLNQPYIFEEFSEDDGFVEDFFGAESLKMDPNFNIKDFNGFLVNRQHKKYIQGMLGKIKADDSENAMKHRELLKLQGLNLYLNEQITRDLKQQKLIWERNNPGRDADTEGIQFNISPGNFNPSFIKDWMKVETPYVYNQLEKNQLKIEKEYQKVVKSGGDVSTGEFLNKIGSNAWLGFWHDFTTPLATYTMESLPGEYTDEIAENWRRNTLINNFEKGDNLRYGYKRGRKLFLEDYGVEYLVDNTNRIYDTTHKIEATALLTPEQRSEIISRVRRDGSAGSSASGYGLAFESSRVIGDLFGQVALTRGIGKFKAAVGGYTKGMGVLGNTKRFLKSLPVKSVVADAIIAQSTIGFVRGYEDTMMAGRAAGLPEDEVRELAASASTQTGFWYAITAPISPQTKAQNLLFGKPVKENIEVAVQRYMKGGWKGWSDFWKTQGQRFGTREGLKQTGKDIIRTADMIQREGWKELFQENIQQFGETTQIGADINRQAGQQIVKEDYTLQDFIHTSALSFTAGAFMPGAGTITSSANHQLREFMGWDAVDRFNSLAFMAYNESDLKSLLASQIEQGIYTQQEVDNLLGEVDQYKNTINHVPPNMSAKAASTILSDIQQLNQLENDKKKAPKGFTGYDDQIQALKDRINNTYYNELTKSQRKGIMAAARAGVAGDTIYKAFDNEQQALDYLKSTVNKYSESLGREMTNQEFERYLKNRFLKKGSFGAMFDQDGTKYALEFKYNAAKPDASGRRMTQTAQHEFFHALINEVVKNDPEAGRLLGKALFNELAKLDLQLKDDADQSVLPSSFKRRLLGYLQRAEDVKEKVRRSVQNKAITKQEGDRIIDEALSNSWEEALTLYSEAIGDPDVQLNYDENAIQKIRNSWRRAMQFVGARDIDLGSGKDVFNMLRDYNKSVKSGMLKYNRAFKKLGEKQGLTEEEKKGLQQEEKELETTTKEKLKKKKIRQQEKADRFKKVAETIVEKNRKRAERRAAITAASTAATTDEEESQLADEIDTKFSMRVEKRLNPDEFKDNINSYYSPEVFSTQTGIDSVVYDILQDYTDVISYKIQTQYSNLPNILIEDLIAETQVELLKHIRNFNKEFLKLREQFKDGLAAKGMSQAEISKRLEAQDKKGYKNKKGETITENTDLNAWINAQLNNKIKEALKKPGITTQKFTGEIDERTTGEIDESTAREQKIKFDEDQDQLIELLSDPVFSFVDIDGNDITIETIPLGDRIISLETLDDPDTTINKRIAAEEDPEVKKQLEQQKRDLKRGLELEAIQGRTKAENDELQRLRNFEAFDLGSGSIVKTYEALRVAQNPVEMIIKQVENEILRSPNIETLQFYNFQKLLQDKLYPLVRTITFKKGSDLDKFMYDNWKLLLDVINNPVDPITGESTYSAKMMPEVLKEFNDQGQRIKKKKVTRALFLQTYYGKAKATEIINKYSKSPAAELKQLGPVEITEKTGREIGLTGVFDRRTSLIRLITNVAVLQQARKSLRNQSFLNQIGNKNPNLYNELKNDNIMDAVLNDMASGKSSSVRFSINNDLSPFFKGRTALQQILMSEVMAKAKINTQVKSKRSEVKNSRKFFVPNLGKMKDQTVAFYLIDKFSKGYNNFEFRNIENSQGKLTKQLLEEGDVKFSSDFNYDEYSTDLNKGLNQIVAENENISPEKQFDNVEARAKGKKGKYRNTWWMGPADQDYKGLLWMLARASGAKGDQQIDWLYENLLDPYEMGNLNLRKARISLLNSWMTLLNKYPGIKGRLEEKVPGYGEFTYGDAIRIYLWNKGRMKIPGLSKKNEFELSNIIRKDKTLRTFANEVSLLSKQPNGYIEPEADWSYSTLMIDISKKLVNIDRKKYLAPWIQKVDLVFTPEMYNKLEAVYGKPYREALENMIYSMKTGKNQNKGEQDKATSGFMGWLNGSVGVTMFLNARSAMLQLISTINYINTSDNNVLKFGVAMANVPQMSKDFLYLWNSDYMKDRRQGMLTSLQEQEIQDIIRNTKEKDFKTVINNLISWTLKKGFILTRIFDSIAISAGGATFYRNRIGTYLNEGFSKAEAEEKAYFDWFKLTEEAQQSGDPSKISMNQASQMGRLMLAFQNTPLQYGRIIKRGAVDLLKRRGTGLKDPSQLKIGKGDFNNASKVLYYSTLQYAVFAFIQNALFAKFFDEEEQEWPSGKYDKQESRFWNGWLDSMLRGAGLPGAYLAWAKNIGLKGYQLYNDPKNMYKSGEFALALTDGLTPIAIKARKVFQAYNTLVWNKKENDWLVEQHGLFSLKNPYMIQATAAVVEGFTNIPTSRIYNKLTNVSNAFNQEYSYFLRLMFLLGYSTWNLGLEDGSSGRRGKASELDFGPNIEFDNDLRFAPKIKF